MGHPLQEVPLAGKVNVSAQSNLLRSDLVIGSLSVVTTMAPAAWDHEHSCNSIAWTWLDILHQGVKQECV